MWVHPLLADIVGKQSARMQNPKADRYIRIPENIQKMKHHWISIDSWNLGEAWGSTGRIKWGNLEIQGNWGYFGGEMAKCLVLHVLGWGLPPLVGTGGVVQGPPPGRIVHMKTHKIIAASTPGYPSIVTPSYPCNIALWLDGFSIL
uniref:Uncharacterized protein n=1 Tax=Eutreptiella gymnastica TaxID=73025 RepID=A0A7S1J730_9EUGL